MSRDNFIAPHPVMNPSRRQTITRLRKKRSEHARPAAKMDNAQASNRIQHLYLTGVRPNGKDIGVGAYGKVFEVEYCGTVFAAKEIHSILVQDVRREELEATKKAFLTECFQSGSLAHPNIVLFLGVYNRPVARNFCWGVL